MTSLTDAWNWRATFFFLAAFCGLSLASFLLFKDTFRRERSSAYQAALARHKDKVQDAEAGKLKRPKLTDKRWSTLDSDERTLKGDATPPIVSEKKDVEAGTLDISKLQAPVMAKTPSVQDVSLTFRDINPFAPLPGVLRVRSNLIILFASGQEQFHFRVLSISDLMQNYQVSSSRSATPSFTHALVLSPTSTGSMLSELGSSF